MSTTPRALFSVGTGPVTQHNGVYQAVVVNNSDPLSQNRIRAQIPQILGTALSNWISPATAVTGPPVAGSTVNVMFLGGDINYPIYLSTYAGGSSVDWLNVVTGYGADNTGVRDSTTQIQNALNALPSTGGVVYFPSGSYLINSSSPLTLSKPTRLIGDGATSIIKIGTSFTGAEAISVASDSCEVSNIALVGSQTTVTSNPVCNGIEIVGFQRLKILDVFCQYINGYAFETIGGASRANLDIIVDRFEARNCAGGIHDKGVTGSNYLGEHFYTDIQMQQIGATTGLSANLDAFMVEDCTDILVENINIGTAATTIGGAIHVKGGATVKITNPDVGTNQASGVAPAIFIESGATTPGDITIMNGSAEGGVSSCRVDSGTDITLTNLRVHQSYTTGLVINGGEVIVMACSMASNNQSGGTGYDIDCSGMTTGNARFIGVRTETSLGSGAGLVTNPVSTSTHAYFNNCYFIASNNTPSQVFTGTPQIIKNCIGYNPRGSITAPTITASPFSSNTSQQDVLIIFTAVNSLTAFKIGGTAVGVLPVTGQAYFVPARSTLELDYSAAAPTWQWYGC